MFRKIAAYLFRSFSLRVIAAIVGSMLFVFMLGNYFIFQFALDSQNQAVRDRLMTIARTASLFVDAELFEQVPLTPEGIHSPAFRRIADNLNKIKTANPRISYIYTMKRTAEPGIWQFVVDPDYEVSKDGEVLTSYPGDLYRAARYPQMLKAFDGPAADLRINEDEWGAALSGYAPILDGRGEAVGMIGVDLRADDIRQMRLTVYRRGLLVMGAGVLLSLAVGFFTGQRITGPFSRLSVGTRELARGNLKHRVQIFHGNDEIGELADSFNMMASQLEESRDQLLNYFYDVVKTLIKILELRDQYTLGHSEAVSARAGLIASRMGYSPEEVGMLKKIALLHDIGKIGIHDDIINKKGPLTPREWEIIKQHPLIGEDILKPVLRDEAMLAVVRQHHERYDGKGYPDGLSGDQISLFAAIVAVADSYDAMTAERAYKKALSRSEAVQELKLHCGSQFHPEVVAVFLKILEEERDQA
jgi:putative nucleotidyltransferase with HDIG domain